MHRTRTFLSFLLALILLLVLIVAIALIFIIRSPYPKTQGTIDVAGLQAPVTIQRDELGVVHIYAQNEHDLFFCPRLHARPRAFLADGILAAHRSGARFRNCRLSNHRNRQIYPQHWLEPHGTDVN